MNSWKDLSGLQQFLLVSFRFCVGWHLFYQGLGKLQSAQWSSLAYLQSATGPFAWIFRKIAEQDTWLWLADQGTMWGLVVSGLLLMVGLFTRTASAGAILLLLLFYSAQPPFPFHGFGVRTPDGSELYVNKILIEIMALAVCLSFDTGKISGLDLLIGKRLRSKRGDAVVAGTAAASSRDA